MSNWRVAIYVYKGLAVVPVKLNQIKVSSFVDEVVKHQVAQFLVSLQ